ncbi:amino acid racemase [Candidatus Azambacteria bacterium]|nr:amino acid racemase [Candidatus Azambacteria bacterium]
MINTSTSKTQNKKKIGILGGMGPLASANIYLKIVKIAQEMYHAEQDTDFPPIFIYSLPLFGFDETGFVDPTLVKDQLITGVKKLEDAGSNFIIIACNTVHHFYQEMQNLVKIPILSIIEETAKAIKEKGYKVVGLLSSESTNELKIYQKIFNNYSIKVLSLNKHQQNLINQVIIHVMAGTQGYIDKRCIQSIIDNLCEQGAESIVLGCTELPLIFNQDDTNIPLFDSAEIIVKSALKHSLC